ncbi:hypothetical protein K469DRAFT_689018 [Zopfia rhizophila CBS 207.26]|uniref:Uncharacterized protein n=1 Tax=Zopfia rhizophila CBS 207.26 TaxID=1314779 RepID=A0A6A6EQT5_9PEZI|nr:hypothetical protein K469DRAFT_689018 [Zopfia rhizophila CBS 207.26]
MSYSCVVYHLTVFGARRHSQRSKPFTVTSHLGLACFTHSLIIPFLTFVKNAVGAVRNAAGALFGPEVQGENIEEVHVLVDALPNVQYSPTHTPFRGNQTRRPVLQDSNPRPTWMDRQQQRHNRLRRERAVSHELPGKTHISGSSAGRSFECLQTKKEAHKEVNWARLKRHTEEDADSRCPPECRPNRDHHSRHPPNHYHLHSSQLCVHLPARP